MKGGRQKTSKPPELKQQRVTKFIQVTPNAQQSSRKPDKTTKNNKNIPNKKQRTTTNDKEKKKYRGYWTALALKSKAEKIEKKVSSTEVLNSESKKARSVSSPNGTCIGELNKKSSTGTGINATVKVLQNNDDSGIREITIRK